MGLKRKKPQKACGKNRETVNADTREVYQFRREFLGVGFKRIHEFFKAKREGVSLLPELRS